MQTEHKNRLQLVSICIHIGKFGQGGKTRFLCHFTWCISWLVAFEQKRVQNMFQIECSAKVNCWISSSRYHEGAAHISQFLDYCEYWSTGTKQIAQTSNRWQISMPIHSGDRVISVSTPNVIFCAVTTKSIILLHCIAYLYLINRISV